MARKVDKWWVMAAMVPPLFVLTLDLNGATVALPAIADDLGASTTGLQWIVNAYLLAFAALQVPAGRLGDVYGRRLVLVLGLGVFAAASLLSGLAWNEEILIAGRVLQGAGAAMLFAPSLSLVSAAFPPAERSYAIGLWSAIGVTGAAAGPLVAGILTDALSWRWFFFVNVPLSIVGIVMALMFVEEVRDPTADGSIDLIGLGTVTTGLLAIVFGIQSLDTASISSPVVLAPLIAGVALLVVFSVVELRVSDPLIDLRLFRGLDFLSAAVVGAISQWIFFSTTFFVTLYLQNVLRLSPLEAGLVFLSLLIPFVVWSALTGRYVRIFGVRIGMSLGILLMGVGAGLIAFAGTDVLGGILIVSGSYFVFSIGNAYSYNVSTSGGMVAVDDARAGAAAGILSASKFVTGALGLAVVGAVFKMVENDHLADDLVAAGLPDSDRGEVEGLLSGSEAARSHLTDLAPSLAGSIDRVADDAFIAGLGAAMILNLVVGILGAAVGLAYRTPETGKETEGVATPSA